MASEPPIKCVIWDLDDTLWDGTLAENDPLLLRKASVEAIKTLDQRGILHSIASRNDRGDALAALARFGLDRYFLYPEIHWGPKSESVRRIAEHLNLRTDSFLFLDDQPFERAEVKSVFDDVWCADGAEIGPLLARERLNPRFLTQDSSKRRAMYQADIRRRVEEESYQGTKPEFLASLGMRLTISLAGRGDLKRAEELTIRTNQLNATGRVYSMGELEGFLSSDRHTLLVCELTDVYGSYGKIGLVLIEEYSRCWHLRLLIMSCRVMSRGVGKLVLEFLVRSAMEGGKDLRADFRPTGRNRVMFLAYKFSGFRELMTGEDGVLLLERGRSAPPPLPEFISIETRGFPRADQGRNQELHSGQPQHL